MNDSRSELRNPAPNDAEPIPAHGPACLVTGGAGYLGAFLIRRLLELGSRVHSFDLKPCPVQHPRLTSFTGDIRDYDSVREACTGVSTVFHTAAVISLLGLYRRSTRDRVVGINVTGTEQVIRAARDAGVAQLVYTSSNAVSFDRGIVMGDESIPYPAHPPDLYTETKAAAEQLVLEADDAVTGLRTVALRPGGIWGGSDGGIMIREFLGKLASGSFKATIGDGSAQADNTHIDNLVDAELLAAEKLAEHPEIVGGQAYYITDEEPMNAIRWFEPLVTGLGYDWPAHRVPAWLMYGVGYLLEVSHYLVGGREPTLSRTGILKVTRNHCFRTDKARRDLGYRPHVGRTEGLARLLPQARSAMQGLQHERAHSHELAPLAA